MGQSVIVRLHISEGLLSPDKHATVHALLIHPWIKLCCTFVVVCSAYRLKSVFQEMMPTSKGHPVAQKSESCIFLQWLRCVPAATNSVHTNIGRQELWVATYGGEIVGFGKYWPSFFPFLASSRKCIFQSLLCFWTVPSIGRRGKRGMKYKFHPSC